MDAIEAIIREYKDDEGIESESELGSHEGSVSSDRSDSESVAHHAPRGKAVYTVKLPFGSIRYYKSTRTLVATCDKHGPKCRLTRSTKASFSKANPGQGRPFGLLVAWLEHIAGLVAKPTTAQNKAIVCNLCKSYVLRKAARRKFRLADGVCDLLAVERKKRELESDEEPNVVK
jgi:hypothetical protein